MTCDETREQFSELVDGRLAPGERAELAAHLEGCAACRVDLERFRATVSLVRSIEPVRAPAGFPQRVIASAGRPTVTAPTSWWRRVGDRLLFPLPVKLPVEAAAIVLVGLGVAYLYQRTPEFHRGWVESPAHVEQPKERLAAERSVPAGPPPEVPASGTQTSPLATGPGRSRSTERSVAKPAPASPPLAAERGAGGDERRQSGAPAATAEKTESTDVRAKDYRADAGQPAPGAGAPAPGAAPAAPEPPRRVLRDAPREPEQDSPRAESLLRQASPPPTAQDPAARDPVTARLAMKSAPDVIGALTVTSRASATAALRELTARHRGRIVASRDESDATVVDVRLPRDQYAAFVAGLGAVGRWRAERETADLPAEVGISLRLVP